ncbi:MAG TPA: hypothetical protein VKY89_05180 [Thermoanaerobaculia bacterium]|jgi:hypothetical protein|nr:hypothetical protein [Thermoanaerobaculia bacterium]
MIPELRQAYNAAFTEDRYHAMVAGLEAEAGLHVPFRICETPVFLPAALAAELERAAGELLAAVSSPDYLRAAARAVPPQYQVPGEEAHPVFVQIDLAIAEVDGRLVPRLIELQGFPSLYAFQWLLTRAYRRHFDLPGEMTPYFAGLDDASYVDCLRRTIVGDADPRTVVLLEIEPEQQKTRVDFVMTEKLLGVPTVGLAEVTVRGRQAFYRRRAEDGGGEVPIRRVYNRVIFDELARRGLALPELFRADLDLEWVGHPNWFWKLSKFSLPFLHSQYAPPCHFLSELRELPADLDNYVLKPLFSFAGLGVEVGVTAERLAAIARPEDYILQRRIEYAPAVVTPDVPAKLEVRMMYVWREQPLLINNLVRMTKGKMVGVDFNKDRTWVGSSLALHPPAARAEP